MPKTCQALNRHGTPCQRYAQKGSNYCHTHDPNRKRCLQPGCKKPAIAGLDYCAAHRRDGGPTVRKAGHKYLRLNPKTLKSGRKLKPLCDDKLADTAIRLEILAAYVENRVTNLDDYYRAADQLRLLAWRFGHQIDKRDLSKKEIKEIIAAGKAQAQRRLAAERQQHDLAVNVPILQRSPPYDQILEYIENYYHRNGQAPFYREIAAALDIANSTVAHYLDQLIADGKLHKAPQNGPQGRILRLGPAPGQQLPLF